MRIRLGPKANSRLPIDPGDPAGARSYASSERASTGSFGIGPDEEGRVEAPLEEVHPPVEVRSGRAARRPDLRDGAASPDPLAPFGQDAREVQEGRRQPVAVVDDEGAAGKEQVRLGEGDQSVRGSADLRPGGGRDVDPVVRLARLAVEGSVASRRPR